ncbi:hypothetical protein OC845_004375, partial [Tilletia horrida]
MALQYYAIKCFCRTPGTTYYPSRYEEPEDDSEYNISSDGEDVEQQATPAVPRMKPPTAAESAEVKPPTAVEFAEAAARAFKILNGPERAHVLAASDDKDGALGN